MQDFGSRLKKVRQILGVSQREMVKRMGVSLGTWQAWETGRHAPNSEVLAQVAALGFDGHWLLTGQGAPQRAPEEGGTPEGEGPRPIRSIKDAQRQVELELMEELGLGEILLLARRGTQASQWRILQVLNEAQESQREGLTQEMLFSHLVESEEEPDPKDLAADLQLLALQGFLRLYPTGLIQLSERAVLTPAQDQDSLQVFREAVRMTAQSIIPCLRRPHHPGVLMTIEASLPPEVSEEAMEQLRSIIRRFLERFAEEDGPSKLSLVIGGATAEPPKKTKS